MGFPLLVVNAIIAEDRYLYCCVYYWDWSIKVSPNDGQLDFGDIVSLIHKELADEGYNVTNFYEEELNLPIDLCCDREINEKPEYCFVLVASLDHISKDFQKMLMFYQYYISYDYKPSEYKVILAVPAGAKVEHTPYYADSEAEKEQDFYKEKGFGLWKVSEQGIDKETYSPMPLWDRITKDYVDNIAKNNKRLLNIQDTITSFADKYIHDAVLGIRGPIIKGREAIKLEERHIDSQLLQKILKLKKISYRNYLYQKITEHLSYKGYKSDEYDFVQEVFSKLWEDSIRIPYSDFLKKFDPALQHVFVEKTMADKKAYRDHYIHQFQVFLSGLVIMDILYDDFSSKYQEPEICWLITSSFHDMAYPVQRYDEWSDEFFKNIFGVGEMGRLELRSKFIDNSFLTCVSRLLTRLCSVFLEEDLTGDWYTSKSNLIHCLYQEVTEAKNHCILSSVSLLKMVEEQYRDEIDLKGLGFDDVFDKIIIPSALSIAIHDKYLWRKLKDEGKWQSQGERCPLPLLKYKTDPLTFLLIFCDAIQEWGRPYKSDEEYGEERKQYFYLKDFTYDSSKGFNITLWSPGHNRTEKFFTSKEEELNEISTFIQQPSHAKFNIRVEDKDGNGESYSMGGPT